MPAPCAAARHIALALAALVFAPGCGSEAPPAGAAVPADWPVYGGNAGGQRYSALDDINPQNVQDLEVAWEYHTGDVLDEETRRVNHAFEATPILLGDTLYFCTPRSRVVAVDAESGTRRWEYDPLVEIETSHYNFNCRGVAHWRDPQAAPGEHCRDRIYVATADTRLVAVDAERGEPCTDFGDRGAVEFWRNIELRDRREYGISSPPVLVGSVIVLGSSVAENRRVDMPSGMVQAFDARSGALLWTWDPVPRDPADPARATWEDDSADVTGGANVWSLASADPERDLVFVPTSSPSPDWYGGERRGENRHADSVVALRGRTGELVWAFQTVHHDLWDYDLASQPVLIDLPVGDTRVPAVAQGTKMGHLFFLHRETGEPLIPVEERPVPQTDVPGEWTSPTQPFPEWPPPLSPQRLLPGDAWGLTVWDRKLCREKIAGLRSEGIFTPPSLQGSVIYPGTAGGMNWGSVAYDPERRLLFANTSNIAGAIQLVPIEQVDPDAERWERARPMLGTPYATRFSTLISPLGIPCNPPPWGSIAALDLGRRELRWQSTLGSTRDLAPVPIGMPWGTPNMGGPLATAGGVVFIAAALDDYLRAYDSETGEELWRGRLPAGGQATPLTYRVRAGGRQFVVIAAGGHNMMRSHRGDSLMAFALPD